MKNTKARKKYHKLTEQEKKEILNLYMISNSKKSIAKIVHDYDITEQQIFNIVKKAKENNSLLNVKKEGEQSIIEQSNNFSKRVEELIELTLGRIEKELQEGEKITLSQLSTTLGILYDKSRLEKNLSTSNQEIHINIKVEK
jgi:nucleoid DNA-binding protein